MEEVKVEDIPFGSDQSHYVMAKEVEISAQEEFNAFMTETLKFRNKYTTVDVSEKGTMQMRLMVDPQELSNG